jgi:hypothetical protein
MNVVHLSLKMLLAPQTQQRPKGDFMDETVSGGKLLSYNEMLEEKRTKDEAKRAKQDEKRAVKQARESAKLAWSTEAKKRREMAHHDRSPRRKTRKRSHQHCPELPTCNEADAVQTWVF